jgi:hypothetical protein
MKIIDLRTRLRLAADPRLAGPSEMSAALSPEEMGRRRSLWCPAYERCLEVAFRSGWRSWTCEVCPQFGHAEPFRKLEAAMSFDARHRDFPPDGGPQPTLP